MNPKARLIDVANYAGVAVGTASRVLNSETNVNPDARARVLEAVAKLQYEPLRKHRAGGSLPEAGTKNGESVRNIGVLFLGMDMSLVNVPIMNEILQGIDAEISRHHNNLLYANLPNADQIPSFLKHNEVEGLIVKTSQYGSLPDPEKKPLINYILRYPIVWVWARPEGAPGDLCSFNHQTAATLAAGHLKRMGHRHVAYFNPKMGKSSLEHMKAEFFNACRAIGLQYSALEAPPLRGTHWPEPALLSPGEVLPLVHTWRETPDNRRPTALFVPADNIALHLYGAMEKLGIKPGVDLSIVACNNEKSLVQILKPRLTTIDAHAEQIGRRSVNQLISRMDQVRYENDQTILYEPTLLEGESVIRLQQ